VATFRGCVVDVKIPSLLRIKPKALTKIGKYLASSHWNNVVVIWGEGLQERFGNIVEVSFATAGIRSLAAVVASTNEVAEIVHSTLSLPPNLDAVVALGGGKALDFGKYVAHLLRKPLVVVPTTISNDGFCSPSASLSVEGRRRSFATDVPDMVILDTEILASAPLALMMSGIGDLFCKATSVWDWKYAYRTKGVLVNDFAAVIALNAVDTFDHFNPKDLKNLEFLRILSSSLMMCGLSMAIAGSSRPASGAEHLISHAYDQLAQKTSWHGVQVGVASYLVAHLQQSTLEQVKRCAHESGFWDFVRQHPLERAAFLHAIREARFVKQNYPTILDEPDSVERLIELCNRLPEMAEVLDSGQAQ